MNNINQKLLQEIEKILYYGAPGGKTQKEATELIDYICHAFNNELEKIPNKYLNFTIMMRCHWQNMKDLSLSQQKKYIHTQVHGLWEDIKD